MSYNIYGKKTKYTCNNEYFKTIDSEEKAYWLGFLYADGCINIRRNNDKIRAISLEIGLSTKDKSHIEKALKCFESNHVIKDREHLINNKHYYSSRVIINSTELCNYLIDKGCNEKKSFNLKFPTKDIVPDNLILHFMRGYLDGDGCISFNKDNQCSIDIIGNLDFISTFQTKIIEKIKDINFTKLREHRTSKNMYYLTYHGNIQCETILKLLYEGSSIYLDRKYNLFYNNFIRKKNKGTYKFYENTTCVYFPCHRYAHKDFNCMFCYCPLLFDMECGGNYNLLSNGMKDCSNCILPHKPENYDYIINKLTELYTQSFKI